MSLKHFTYSDEQSDLTLKQGDILSKTQKLIDVLSKYHSHYVNPEYTHYQVLTQSCDLVRRGSKNKCSSRYITLAAVRSLDTVIERAVKDIASKFIESDSIYYCSTKHKDRLATIVESLINQNGKDYFYLRASPDDGLLEDSCAFLHLSVAIRSSEHYDKCLDAKIIELKENFRSKLGWMVGNLYSRVGTEDYVPGALQTRKEFLELINNILETQIAWVEDESFAEFKKAHKPSVPYRDIIQKAEAEIERKRCQKMQTVISELKRDASLTSDQIVAVERFFNSKRGKGLLLG